MGLASYFLSSSTSTLTICHLSAGVGLLQFAVAERIPCTIRSHGTLNFSCHVLDMWNLLLLGLLRSDEDDVAAGDDALDHGEQLSSDDGLDSVLGFGIIWKSRVTISVSTNKKNNALVNDCQIL